MTAPVAPVASPQAVPDLARAAGRSRRGATRVVVATLGAVVGFAGIEHGIGEIRQGSVAPGGFAILSWPDTPAFRLVAGEPALTIVPNLLATGILAVALSLAFAIWATLFAGRRHGGMVLILLSLAMLLFGGGFGPPVLGIAASRRRGSTRRSPGGVPTCPVPRGTAWGCSGPGRSPPPWWPG